MLSAGPTGVSIRTSTGHLVQLGWDGAPVAIQFTDYTGAGCTGTPYIYLEDPSPLHVSSAFWSPAVNAYAVPTSTPGSYLAAPTNHSYTSFYEAGVGCQVGSGTSHGWGFTSYTPAQIGLGMSIDPPLTLE